MISTDNAPTLAHWSKEEGFSFPMLSDFMRKTAESYGVLFADRGIANRSTFVVDTEGKIQYIEQGNTAVDISGAAQACERVRKK
jgi:peroxiredoxin